MSNLNKEEEFEEKVGFMNVFLCYYKQMFDKSKEVNMFSDVDYDNDASTNRCMEMLYDEMFKYQNCEDEEALTILDPSDVNINKCKELYVLVINNKQEKACQMLLPLIKYVSTLDWMNIDWSINPVKTDNEEGV